VLDAVDAGREAEARRVPGDRAGERCTSMEPAPRSRRVVMAVAAEGVDARAGLT